MCIIDLNLVLLTRWHCANSCEMNEWHVEEGNATSKALEKMLLQIYTSLHSSGVCRGQNNTPVSAQYCRRKGGWEGSGERDKVTKTWRIVMHRTTCRDTLFVYLSLSTCECMYLFFSQYPVIAEGCVCCVYKCECVCVRTCVYVFFLLLVVVPWIDNK